MTAADDASTVSNLSNVSSSNAVKERSQISSEFQDSLKNFIKRGTTASRRERHLVLRELNRLWSSEATGISEGPLQAILFNIGLCLPRYLGDAISCLELLKFIQQILEKSTITNYGLFLSLLSGVTDSMGLEEPSGYSRKLARLTLRVSVIVASKLEKQSTEWKTLVDIQSRLLYVALNTDRRSEENMVYKILRSFFVEDAGGHINKLVQYLTREDASPFSAGFFKFISLLVLRKGNEDLLENVKKSGEILTAMVAHFVRLTFSSKLPAPASFLNLSQTGFLRLVDQNIFKEHLLSPMVKSMLRNPEVVLPAVIAVLKGLTIDLSPFCMEIGKQLGTQLHSKVESSRKLSVDATKYLAQQCSDTAAVDEVVKHLFAVLNGSEGKVSLAGERMDVLSAIGNLSCQPMCKQQSTAGQTQVTALFIAAVSGEVHEAVAVHAISMFSLWATVFTEVPSNFFAVIKNISTQKSSVIRVAYLNCLSTFVKDQTLPADLIPVLSKIVDVAFSKPADMTLVLEALPAACVLLLQESLSATKNATFWNAVTDANKQIFASEKFLLSCSNDALKTLTLFLERIFVLHYDRLKPEAVRMYIRAFSYVLLRSKQAERRSAQRSWRKVLGTQRLGTLSENLVDALKVALIKLKSVDSEKPTEADSQRVQNFSKNAIFVLTDIVETYVELNFPAPEKGRLIVECLLISSEPGIVSLRPGMWISLLRRFRHDSIFPDKLLSDHVDEIWEKLQNEDVLSDEALKVATATFMGFPTSSTVFKFLLDIKTALNAPEILEVTLPDVLLFQSPAGVLYDKSVLETSSANDSAKGNIKRESKAYSYKEQLAEIELRKELEEKRKAKSGGKDAALTPKQKEVVAKQIQKEDVVRQNVQKIYRKIQRPFLLLNSIINGNPECMRFYLSEIIAIVSPLLHVPLTATPACSTWTLMSQCVNQQLKQNGMAEMLAIVTLRVLEPACTFPKHWSQTNLSKSVEGVIHGILSLWEKPEEENGTDIVEFDEDSSDSSAITVSDICFALPLIQVVVNEGQAKKLGLAENVPVEAFRILCKVLELCAGVKNDTLNGILDNDVDSAIVELDENNPAFLPLVSVLETLIEVSQSGKARFENDACIAIGNLATAVTRLANEDANLEKKIIEQLLKLFLSSKIPLRIAAVQALGILTEQVNRFVSNPEQRLLFEKRLFIAAHDEEDPKVAEFAKELFRDLDLRPTVGLLLAVIDDVTEVKEFLRNSAAATLGNMLPHFPDMTGEVLDQLLKRYNKNVEDSKPKVDKFGRPTTDQQIDSWPARRGIAAALVHITPCLGQETFLRQTMEFLLQNPCALKDEKGPVRNDMLQVAVALVDHHGKQHVTPLLAKLEEFLATAPKTADFDVVRQSAIVIMGNLARHLDAKHLKIRPVVHQLLAALSTPSEEVQKAVSRCIAPLVVNMEEDIKAVVPNLLHVLYESDSYAHRRGAAYGLAGVFQGLGIMSLKDYDIMVTIMGGLQDKKNAQRRESSLLAISMLSMGLGRVFEPFVVQAIPYVLQSIGDGNLHVRQAAEEASKAAMSQLSGPGLKLILPALLKGLQEDAWRSKSAAIEMLGDMAFCAPRQLSSCLPTVVPNLIETLGDSHVKVQESAVSALKKIASVIKNPEVVGLVPNILTALQDPAKKTSACLKTILQTQFIHVIDAASLALLMPVIRRAIYDRGTENRKLSAQIMASLYSLADQKDLLPYLEGILPGLKNCLLDPAPEVRLCAAKAIAALIQGTGEAGFDQLKEWLFAKLVSESNSVDRSGAAQGLAESLGVLGVKKLRAMLPEFLDIILNEKTPSHVRDGYLLVFVYLPAVFGQDFSSFISDVIPALLIGLADDAEYVRETALQCGQRIVTFFADSAIELLLPQLEVGMFDENWRIRFASVQLLGDLLYKISGASGKHTTAGLEEDENFGTEQSHAAILHRLGENHRNRVLAGLYISRSDNALVVRQAALHVWKVIVTNTPKTLREILPELFEILLDALASEIEERRQVAAKTLGELVRKLGERILPEIIPILQDGLKSQVDEHREGVCVGLMEIISSSNKETVIMYCDILEPTLTKALMDKYPGVRRAAADAFCMLDSVVGHRVLDDILPVLFDKVTDPVDGDNALDGLQQIMARRSRIVLPYLIPRLTTPPVNTKTLALITAVAGEALSKHLGKILPSLLASLQTKIGTPDEETEIGYCKSVMLSVDDEAGVATLVDTLMSGAQTEKNRLAAITLLDLFYANTKVDVRSFFVSTIRQLIRLYMSDDPILIKKVSSVIGTLIKKTPTDVIYENVTALRTAIRSVHMELKVPCVPGFCLPDGAAVFIPMLRDALLSVAADEKEVVGQTIADLVRLSNQAGLRSSVVTITGPIIRILGDRYAPSVRAVMLEALNCLIEKCTLLIKPFVPQIQTTVSRALSDPTRSVRIKAGNVAASIAPMHPRLETLANDLLEVAKTNADLATKETALRSLRSLLAAAGARLSAQYRSDVVAVTSRYLDSEENDLKNAAAGCLGAVVRFMADEELAGVLKNHIFDTTSTDWGLQHGHCLALGAALKDAGDKLVSETYADQTMEVILKHHASDRVPIAVSGTRCIGLYLLYQRKTQQPLNKKLLIVLAKSFNHAATEVKQRVAEISSHLALASPDPLDISELKILVPQIVNGTKEKNTAVRYDSEMALADVLALRKDDSLLEACKAAMDSGARESLQNARKTISKSVFQAVTKLEELDETLPKF